MITIERVRAKVSFSNNVYYKCYLVLKERGVVGHEAMDMVDRYYDECGIPSVEGFTAWLLV